MIANNTSAEGKAPILVAAEDSLVVGIYSFVAGIIATGAQFPPTSNVLWATGLAAVLAGTISWAKARNVAVK